MAKKAKKGYSLKEKLLHYTDVARGEKSVKETSKFSENEQRAYARGQRDARNEGRRVWASMHASEADKQAYKERQEANRAAYKQSKKLNKVGD